MKICGLWTGLSRKFLLKRLGWRQVRGLKTDDWMIARINQCRIVLCSWPFPSSPSTSTISRVYFSKQTRWLGSSCYFSNTTTTRPSNAAFCSEQDLPPTTEEPLDEKDRRVTRSRLFVTHRSTGSSSSLSDDRAPLCLVEVALFTVLFKLEEINFLLYSYIRSKGKWEGSTTIYICNSTKTSGSPPLCPLTLPYKCDPSFGV